VIFHVLTIFPEFFQGPFEHGVIKRARDTGALEIRIHNLRDWTSDRHKTVDDRPFGGGEGMLLKPEPLFLAVESIFWSGQAWPVPRPCFSPRRAACSTRRWPTNSAAGGAAVDLRAL
jgi:tRNA G37 N-methylase TrmD